MDAREGLPELLRKVARVLGLDAGSPRQQRRDDVRAPAVLAVGVGGNQPRRQVAEVAQGGEHANLPAHGVVASGKFTQHELAAVGRAHHGGPGVGTTEQRAYRVQFGDGELSRGPRQHDG